ncbi:MAG: heme ABC exporter ATP-binding protein CcmA [Pseudomonadota bacterium]
MPSYDCALSLEKVDCERGGSPVLKGVNFDAKSSDTVLLFGANGSGKSTFLSVVAGLTTPTSGVINWRIGEASGQGAIDPLGILFVGHRAPVKTALTALENLNFWFDLYHAPEDNRAKNGALETALERVGLLGRENDRVGSFSAGMKRRLDLARCLIAQRPFWLIDEPTAALDEAGKAIFCEILKEHACDGGCALVATHEALHVDARVVRLG